MSSSCPSRLRGRKLGNSEFIGFLLRPGNADRIRHSLSLGRKPRWEYDPNWGQYRLRIGRLTSPPICRGEFDLSGLAHWVAKKPTQQQATA